MDGAGLGSGYRRLWRDYLSAHWPRVLAVLGFMAIVALASAGYAKFVQVLFEAFDEDNFDLLFWAPIAVVLLTAIRGGAQYLQISLSNRILSGAEAELQGDLMAALVEADVADLQREPPAAIAARFSSDIGAIHRALDAVALGVGNLLIVVATFVTMLTINWGLTLLTLGLLSLAIWPVSLIGSRVNRIAKRVQASTAAMTAGVAEALAGARLVKTYGLESRLKAQAGQMFARLRDGKVQAADWAARTEPVMEITSGVAMAALLGLVIYFLSQGLGTLADFMALLTGLGVAMTPARRLGNTYTVAQLGLASITRVTSLMDRPIGIRDTPDAMPIDRAKGRITFDQVGFAYPDGTVALSDISLEIPAGTHVAFVGRSGAGKSSLLNLLPRLFDPTSGEVRLDGTGIQKIRLMDLRRQIAVVSQDALLLTGSVKDNIAFGHPDADLAAIQASAAAAEADGFIQALPNGYDTPIAPSENSFSGGERQRISIARAILRDAPVLLLDEPTSALDAKSEAAIRRALTRLGEGRTVLTIAHRLSTIREADVIVVMGGGRILETGTHADLLAAEGAYAELYRLQFRDDA